MKSGIRYLLTAVIVAPLLGCGGGSSTSSGVISPATVPGAPTAVTVAAGDSSAVVSFLAPASDGGSAITGYTARCAAVSNSASATGAASPLVVSSLTNAATYSCTVTASNAVGSGAPSAAVSVTPATTGAGGKFALSSPAVAEGGALPIEYTCDGTGSTLALNWSGAPSGTKEYALLMTTLPGDGTTKWSWVLYSIPASRTALAKDTFGIGTLGTGSDNPGPAYDPPCSQGPGTKIYTFTLYALSGSPAISLPPAQVTGNVVADAIAPLTLGSATLNVAATRTTLTGSSAACLNIRNSTLESTSGTARVSCDGTYAYFSSAGIAGHTMMDGITATNLQVPVPQNFNGANGWKIPLAPAVAATTVTAVDGPIGVAINGVPIFNPCKQGGCQNGDTKVLGELDRCNGHAGRADDYHYHAAPVCMMAGQPDAHYWDTHPLGWALDGFAIFGYYNADGSVATRDGVCGGNTLPVPNAPSGYSYHVTDASPYVLACFRGTPSPDLANQGSKFRPLRVPPVTPFPVSAMTLTTDASDGYQVLQFTSSVSFTTTETGSDQYANAPGTYRIRYKAVTGAALDALLAQPANAGKSACWNFQFTSGAGAVTQPATSYCK